MPIQYDDFDDNFPGKVTYEDVTESNFSRFEPLRALTTEPTTVEVAAEEITLGYTEIEWTY